MNPATPTSIPIEDTPAVIGCPELGDLVHYQVPDGEIRAAIVTHVWSDELVNLAVFTDGSHPQEFARLGAPEPIVQMTSVSWGHEDGEWHFPEYDREKD